MLARNRLLGEGHKCDAHGWMWSHVYLDARGDTADLGAVPSSSLGSRCRCRSPAGRRAVARLSSSSGSCALGPGRSSTADSATPQNL